MQISAVIPSYNAERCLARAVESVLQQTYPAHEIIVVDDGSKDETPVAAAKFGDRVRYVRQDNAGAAAARNRGIEMATGDWIAFLDADDWWLRDHLANQAAIIARHPNLVWVSGRFLDGWSEGLTTLKPVTEEFRRFLAEGEYFPDFYEGALAGFNFSTCAMLIQKKVLVNAGLFDVTLKVSEDCDLWFRIADRHPVIGYVDSPLFVYDHSTPQSLTKAGLLTGEQFCQFLAKHVRESPHGKGEALLPKERFFKLLIAMSLRIIMKEGDSEGVRRIVRQYGKWLSGRLRLLAGILGWFPRPVLRGGAAAYAATMGRVRARRFRARAVGEPKLE
jgi:glycosyltransferase involved in cell wall biosynthesis